MTDQIENAEAQQPLPLKWRPINFEEVVGNDASIKSVKKILTRPLSTVPASWLFTGPPGTGKTTLARILKDELGCDTLCFTEMNAGNTRGIDTIRKVAEDIQLYAAVGNVKVILFDECHQLTKDAQEAMLKMLEDAPENTFFLLCTTNPEKIIKAIKSRCVQIAMKSVAPRKIKEHLNWVIEQEGFTDFADDVLVAIAKGSDGSLRNAMKMLDMVYEMDSYDDMLEVIKVTTVDESSVKELCLSLMAGKSSWQQISELIQGLPGAPEDNRRSILGFIGNTLLTDGSKSTAILAEFFEKNYYDNGKTGLILSCFAAHCELGIKSK